jgi:ATP-dependent helicase/nuclease subunit B
VVPAHPTCDYPSPPVPSGREQDGRRGPAGPSRRLVVGAAAAERLAVARRWLVDHDPASEVLVVAPTLAAADDLVRTALGEGGARFGVHRTTLDRLAARLAAPALARAGRTPASPLALAAVAARAIHRLAAARRLGRLDPMAGRPGFAAAVARTATELREAGVAPAALAALPPPAPDVAELLAALEEELAEAKLADRAGVFAAATAAAAAAPAPLGVPLLLLDLALEAACEVDLVAALVARAPAVLATVPRGDVRTEERLRALLAAPAEPVGPEGSGSLATLQTHLFEGATPPPAALDGSVVVRSSPGEARECVEIARTLQAEAARGVPFDRMAVLLHAPAEYAIHVEEALRRAAIPAFFARGTRRPHPAGRALLALLACAAEGLSARRFAEYLSLGQVPDPSARCASDGGFVPPASDLLPPDAALPPAAPDDDPVPEPDDAAVVAGAVRAPWRWERLLVDAAVIGGQARWRERLAGLEAELRRRRAALVEEGDEARAAHLARTLGDLAHLRAVALPLIDRLAALPERAPWGEWLAHLSALAVAALRAPAPVLAVLAELEPMAPVGPVELDEVALVLDPRLRELAVPETGRRYGAVFVAPIEAARGLVFDVVCVPGLAERIFPRKIVEDPLLPDAARTALGAGKLATAATRVAAERLALRLAVGAAAARVVLSYPRLDVEQARPRVPSFYALEVLRATEGRLPGFEELAARRPEGAGRLGWPAPERPEEAIDEAEYDLALLTPLLDGDAAAAVGAASYLLGANPHLGRALRARARRWLRRWTPNDGLVDPDARARAALARHTLAARSFSPTALQHFAACPYRFFLQAIHRLAPREEAAAAETLDPLTRGALVHEVQFATLTRLRAAGLLPVRPPTLACAWEVLDGALDAIAASYRDALAPAIPRVWDDGIAAVRADLREWLRREAEATDGWVPERFELSFGIVDRDRPDADPASVREPVPLPGGLQLRGAIDLVERRADGMLRVTDHKTGRPWAKPGVVVGGGQTLQPLLYALAAEQLLGAPAWAGRLYYCTADGGYTERVVRLDETSRALAAEVAGVIDGALRAGFLPAAPRPGACARCDYRPVCGPHEELRTARKPPGRLRDLARLRALP